MDREGEGDTTEIESGNRCTRTRTVSVPYRVGCDTLVEDLRTQVITPVGQGVGRGGTGRLAIIISRLVGFVP